MAIKAVVIKKTLLLINKGILLILSRIKIGSRYIK